MWIVNSPYLICCKVHILLEHLKLFLVVSRPGPQNSTSRALSWIQCKLGKHYLWKKVTLPWESNPEPNPGRLVTILVSVVLKKHLTSRKTQFEVIIMRGPKLLAKSLLRWLQQFMKMSQTQSHNLSAMLQSSDLIWTGKVNFKKTQFENAHHYGVQDFWQSDFLDDRCRDNVLSLSPGV